MTFRLDMTMMFTIHDALRRELERIARITARPDDDPRRILRTAVGWELFKTFLRVHHTSEDVALWPIMRHELAGRPDDLALLEALEAEHAAIDPLLAGVDAALADRDHGGENLGGLVDALVTGLSGHLRHEETEGLVLIDATLADRQWLHFAEVHRERIGGEAPRYLPWLLDGADAQTTALILNRMPAPIRTAYHDEWLAAYNDLNRYP
ncbi:hemerythrin domain-containing protein [Streptosporangium sp. CA-115845]|uniref:hemerythrin domain-containing protein n=1 Tax=Streptosporangium sp. CA-115845 TaxID=3240071 RepID=UPI003D8FE4C2